MNTDTLKPVTALVTTLILLISAGAAFAQQADADLARLASRVKAGDTIFVTDSKSQQIVGRLTSVSDSAIAVKVGEMESTIPLPQIREIAKRGDSVRNGALIGAIIGGGLTVTVGASFCADYACSRPVVDTLAVSAINAALFGGIGALIDKVRTGRTVVYRAGSEPRVSLQPILGARQRGVSVTIVH